VLGETVLEHEDEPEHELRRFQRPRALRVSDAWLKQDPLSPTVAPTQNSRLEREVVAFQAALILVKHWTSALSTT
jgi:hypothetical protein